MWAQAQAQLQQAVKGKPGRPAKQTGENATQCVALTDPTLNGAGRQPKDRCQQYLDALEGVTRISAYGLIQSKSGGSDGGETWVHPQVAVDLARWISAPWARKPPECGCLT